MFGHFSGFVFTSKSSKIKDFQMLDTYDLILKSSNEYMNPWTNLK